MSITSRTCVYWCVVDQGLRGGALHIINEHDDIRSKLLKSLLEAAQQAAQQAASRADSEQLTVASHFERGWTRAQGQRGEGQGRNNLDPDHTAFYMLFDALGGA